MSIPRRKGDREPRLTMPGLVRVIVPAIPWDASRRPNVVVPCWTLRAVLLVQGDSIPGPLADTGVVISEPLDVLVVPPAGWIAIRAGYELAGVRTAFRVLHHVVTEVPPERHDPARGLYAADLYPTIRFEEAKHVPE